MTDGSPYLSDKELKEYLGVAQSTLKGWRKDGKGPPFIRMGRLVKYDALDVSIWLEREALQDERGHERGIWSELDGAELARALLRAAQLTTGEVSLSYMERANNVLTGLLTSKEGDDV